MASPLGLTDTDQVRAVLGLSDQDLPDAQMLSRRLDVELRLDLLSWKPDFQLLADAAKSPAATQAQKDIGDALALYSAYTCAALVAKSGPLLVAQQISDGKNSLARFTPIDWDKLAVGLQAQAAKFKAVVDSLTATVTDTVAALSLFVGVGLADDPVTYMGVR